MREEDEEKNHEARARWMERMHRAPPGVDWRAIERENALAQRDRRNTLPPPSSPRWTERGSDNQAGSTFVARWGSDDDTLYVGSAFGGLWRGTREGDAFEPIADDLYGGVHSLEVIPGTPDVLLVTTDGGLVHRSTDQGATWTTPAGVDSLWGVRRLLRTGSGTLYLVGSSDSGNRVYRSDDGGETFTISLDLAGFFGDVWAPRDGGPGVYALTADGVRRSDDDGATWPLVGPAPEAVGSGELTGSEAGGPRLYAFLAGGHVWRSDDAGATWEQVSAISDYWGTLNASITDPELVVYGGVNLYESRDGGETWAAHNDWSEYYGRELDRLHADMMGVDVWLDEDGDEVWHVNCHGGTYRSDDRMETVRNLSLRGLRVSQYYDVLTSRADPTHVAAGAQDQGYQVTNDVKQDGDDVFDFDQAISGDYGHLTSSDGTHGYVYSVYPGFVLIQIGEDAPSYASAQFPSGEAYVPWLPPIVADPTEPTAFFFPASHLYRYKGNGRRWTSTQWSDQDFSHGDGDYVSALAFSPLDPDRAWAATANGRLYFSTDHGVTWTQSQSLGPDENWYYGQAIAPSELDADVITIGGSGYGVPSVYRSTDGGISFRPWDEGLPDTLVYTLVEAPDGRGTLYAGTQTAAYRRGPDDAGWVDITGGEAPVTTYWDAEVLYDRYTVRFATYGRGIWDYDVATTGCYPAVDADLDGVTCLDDCNDGDASVLPGASDPCGDGIDQDCDGVDPACDSGDSGADSGDSGEDGTDNGGNDGNGGDGGDKATAPGCGCATGGEAPETLLVLGMVIGATLRRRRA